MSWTTICKLEDILPNSGVCALFNNKQIAIFRLVIDGEDKLYALDNYDPFSKANVLSRGIVGCISGQYMVASPIYKQHFYLGSGQCAEDESVNLTCWPVQIAGDSVQLCDNQLAAA